MMERDAAVAIAKARAAYEETLTRALGGDGRALRAVAREAKAYGDTVLCHLGRGPVYDHVARRIDAETQPLLALLAEVLAALDVISNPEASIEERQRKRDLVNRLLRRQTLTEVTPVAPANDT